MDSISAYSRAVRPVACELYFLPVRTRTTLSFGHQQVIHIICARVCMTVEDRNGVQASGWGETPLNVQWAWPGVDYANRMEIMQSLCRKLKSEWSDFRQFGHPLEVGHAFLEDVLSTKAREVSSEMPTLAQLVSASAFDIAFHDAFGQLHQVPIYQTYTSEWMNHDLSRYLGSAFAGKYPADYLTSPQRSLLAWHMIGAADPISREDLTGKEPDDDYPVLLEDWIARDCLKAIKIKLAGNNRDWDVNRLLRIGGIAQHRHVPYLSADFNCTASSVEYVTSVLDEAKSKSRETYDRLLYIEQPFGYDLENEHHDVRPIAARKPILLDESAHDWKMVQLGLSRGWTGVALKTCKTQTNAILSLCWARANRMQIMVQDLTNPMLAIIPHVQLASHAGTIAGIEVNACQFYPDASLAEAAIHPGIYSRRDGKIDLTSLSGGGFGYGAAIHVRPLPTAEQV